MANQDCYPYINPWTPAPGAPCGCEDPLPGRGWTGSIIYSLEYHHNTHPNRGFRVGHPALDFDAPTGTQVRAAAAGSVIWAGPNVWGYGNLVILDHGAGYRTLYAHLNTVSAQCGTVVVAGTPIGTVGMTGNTSFEHVHFEVRVRRDVDGSIQWWSCDPHRWLGAEPTPPDEDEEEEDMENLLRNGDLEADWGEEENHRCLVFPESGVYETDIGNIFTPPGWLTWFRHIPDTWDQPEARDARKENDPNRVHSGEKAMLLFTFGRKHDAGFLQVVDTDPGQRLRLTAWCHAWSNHNLPGHEGCFEDGGCSCGVGTGPGFYWADTMPPPPGDQWEDAKQNFLFGIGIDPTGGTDPYSNTVVWGRAAYIYNTYAQLQVEATAEMHLATVFLRSITQWGFKHNDAYWDDIVLEEVEMSERGKPRIQYERTYILLPQNYGKEWALAAVEGSHTERNTVGYSADDAGIGDLDDRNVVAVNPGAWQSDLHGFFQAYYPGVNYTTVEVTTPDALKEALGGPFVPDPPPPPSPYTPLNLINPHLQTVEPGILAVSQVAGRSPLVQKILGLYYTWRYNREQASVQASTFKYVRDANPNYCKVFSFEDVYGILRANPNTIAGVRHFTNDYGGMIDVEPTLGAKRWVDQFRDALYTTCNHIEQEFPNAKRPYFYMEGPNELVPSQNPPLVKRALDLDLAICLELERTGLPIASIGYCAGVGNPHESEYHLIVPLARELERTGGALGLHAYWWASKTESGLDSWWKYHAGRYQMVDEVLVEHNVYVDWLCGESGVVASEDGGHHLNAHSGWGDVMNWDRYLAELLEVNRRDNEWNKTHEGRFKGRAVFTTCAHFCNWESFRVGQPEFEDIAAALLVWGE